MEIIEKHPVINAKELRQKYSTARYIKHTIQQIQHNLTNDDNKNDKNKTKQNTESTNGVRVEKKYKIQTINK